MEVSVVVPLYNSGERVPILLRSLNAILPACGNYEIIFVNDGSQDNTQETINELQKQDPRVRAVHVSRHAGQHQALFTGYQHSQGDIVVTLDDDATEEVRYIPEFIERINQGYDLVSGRRIKYGYPLFKKVGSYCFNLMISLLVKKRIHDIGSPIKAKNRRVVEKIISLGELTRFPKYYRHYRFTEQRIPGKYSQQFASRYNAIKLMKEAVWILKNNIF